MGKTREWFGSYDCTNLLTLVIALKKGFCKKHKCVGDSLWAESRDTPDAVLLPQITLFPSIQSGHNEAIIRLGSVKHLGCGHAVAAMIVRSTREDSARPASPRWTRHYDNYRSCISVSAAAAILSAARTRRIPRPSEQLAPACEQPNCWWYLGQIMKSNMARR